MYVHIAIYAQFLHIIANYYTIYIYIYNQGDFMNQECDILYIYIMNSFTIVVIRTSFSYIFSQLKLLLYPAMKYFST